MTNQKEIYKSIKYVNANSRTVPVTLTFDPPPQKEQHKSAKKNGRIPYRGTPVGRLYFEPPSQKIEHRSAKRFRGANGTLDPKQLHF